MGSWMIQQEDGEIEVARRMTEAGEQGGAFGAVLGAVIDDMGEAVPEDAVARFIAFVADDAAQVFVAKTVKIAPEFRAFDSPARPNGGDIGEIFRLQPFDVLAVFSRTRQAYSASSRCTRAPRRLPQPKSFASAQLLAQSTRAARSSILSFAQSL